MYIPGIYVHSGSADDLSLLLSLYYTYVYVYAPVGISGTLSGSSEHVCPAINTAVDIMYSTALRVLLLLFVTAMRS